MFKPLWIIILVITTMLQLNGMHKPMQAGTAIVSIESAQHFFSKLPAEILNLIAHYLTFNDIETEEEFIARTKNEALQGSKNLKVNWGDEQSFISYCPKVNKAGKLGYIDKGEYLILFNKTMDKELFRKPIKPKLYSYFILSSDADMFATIHSEHERSCMHKGYEFMLRKTVLTVAATTRQEEQEFIVPDNFFLHPGFDFYSSTIAFNKQKTHIVMHGIDKLQDLTNEANTSSIRDHIIIPLTIGVSNASPEKKTLQHYFAQKEVCKQIK